MEKIYETERLIVRKWENKDYKDLFEYASNPEVTKFLTFPTYTSLETAKLRIATVRMRYNKVTDNPDYCIEHKETGKVIGSIGFGGFEDKNEGKIEIGYVLNPKFQGFGYMTEAVKGMFKYIKLNNIAKRIVIRHDVENVKSGNVMKRAGMTFEGIARKAGKNNAHSRHDVAVYSILWEEIDAND